MLQLKLRNNIITILKKSLMDIIHQALKLPKSQLLQK